jgi:DNA-binding NarL/FixJ family response regulator
MLAYLYNKGQSDLLSVEDMCKIIYKYRFTGDLVSLQMLLLLLAERYYLNKDIKSAAYILEDAIELYTQKGLKAPFHLYSYECWPLIRKLSPKIKKTDESNRYFTDKEIDVLKLIVQGKSNKEIGEVLFIGIGTVKWHINNILSKMEVKNRTQAAKKAREQNLV